MSELKEDKKLEYVARKLCLLLEGGDGGGVEREVILDRLPQVARNGYTIITRTCKLWELYVLPARLAMQFAEEYPEKEGESVTITKKEYEQLLDAKLQLTCLEAGGVDNWDWYDDAMDNYREKRSKLNGTPDE